MEFRGAHRSLKFRSRDHFTEKRVRLQKNVIFKKDVVNAYDAFFTQNTVIEIMKAAPHFETDAEVGVVIQIRAGRDNPVHKPGAHEWNYRSHADAGWGHRTG